MSQIQGKCHNFNRMSNFQGNVLKKLTIADNKPSHISKKRQGKSNDFNEPQNGCKKQDFDGFAFKILHFFSGWPKTWQKQTQHGKPRISQNITNEIQKIQNFPFVLDNLHLEPNFLLLSCQFLHLFLIFQVHENRGKNVNKSPA